jgi:16S rRNA (cytosine1402-N4)-methyltransferase
VEGRPINTTLQLVKVIEQVVGRGRGKIHPATKTFQALRMVVNRELENLELALRQALNLLGFGGRLVVISYHSLEDRVVKQVMRRAATDCICPPEVPVCVCGHAASVKLVNKRVITPSHEEVQVNPRSRSARLRAVERITAREDYYVSVEKLCVAMETKTNGWRRPVLLKRLERAFATA